MLYFNLRSSLLMVAMVQGLVIALLLALRAYRQGRVQDYFLAGLLFFLVCSLIEHFIGFMGVYDTMREAGHDLTYFPFSNAFMYGPFIYLYVWSVTDSRFRWKNSDWKHFLLPGLYYLLHFGVWFLPERIKFPFLESYEFTLNLIPSIVFYVSSFRYWWKSMRRYLAYRHLIEQEYANTGKMTLDWLHIFLYSFGTYLAFDLVFSIVGLIWDFWYTGWYWLNLARAVLLYYISVTGWAYTQKSLLDFGAIEARENAISSPQEPSHEDFTTETISETPQLIKPLFTSDELALRTAQLNDFMKNEKSWLDPELTLSSLSIQLDMNTSQLSYLINKGFGKNFNDYVNEFRVEAVKQKMKSPDCQHLSLLGIAFESGFNSKATFNRAFKKLTGLSPSEFIRT